MENTEHIRGDRDVPPTETEVANPKAVMDSQDEPHATLPQHEPLWPQVLDALRQRLSNRDVARHFEPITLERIDDEGRAVLQTPDDFHRAWIEDHYLHHLHHALRQAVGVEAVLLQARSASPSPPRSRAAGSRHGQASQDPAAPPPPPPRQLQLFPQTVQRFAEDACAVPSLVLRSALFGIVQRGKREHFERVTLASWPQTTMIFTGEQLDQADLDLWAAALSLAHGADLDAEIPISLRGLLNTAGKVWSKGSRRWLDRAALRLQSCLVEIETPQIRYRGNLLARLGKRTCDGHYVLRLDPGLRHLLDDGFSIQHWTWRGQLQKDLTKWLMGYLATHYAPADDPHQIGIPRLYDLCGSSRSRMRDFVADIRAALGELCSLGMLDPRHTAVVQGKNNLKLVCVRRYDHRPLVQLAAA